MCMDSPLGLPLRGKRVLVVEDEALVSMLLEDELRDAGVEVLGPAPTVREALRLVEAAAAGGGLSAAVLDINLDGRHVAPVADRLAALGVPFLFATGYGDDMDKAGHVAGPALQKPFAPGNLIAAVEELGRQAAPTHSRAEPQTGRAASPVVAPREPVVW